jgi:ATP-binding cassette subfamily F protein uup
LDLAVKNLSGGERARVHIARLMLQPADILILDEPTNDLDIPTLEVLESNLGDFPGALVLVTHDRFLLDRLTSMLLALDGEGGAEFFAELAQWEQANALKKPKAVKAAPVASKSAEAGKKKLSYLEAREWESIEGRVEEAEGQLAVAHAMLNDPSIVSDPGRLLEAATRLDLAQGELDRLYERWAELSEKAGR